MMLSDTERKVLQIIQNRFRFEWHRPDPDWVSEKAVRDVNEVKKAMRKLLNEGYIESKSGMIRVVLK